MRFLIFDSSSQESEELVSATVEDAEKTLLYFLENGSDKESLYVFDMDKALKWEFGGIKIKLK